MSKKHHRRREQEWDAARPIRATGALQPLSRSTRPHTWPLLECLINVGWQEPGEINQILVARQSDTGEVGAAVFLVDLGCLGVKDAFASRFPTLEDYALGLRAQMTGMRPVEAISIDLAAKIVREAIAYARSLGLQPHRDYAQAAPYLADADADAATEEVPLGRDGKPYLVNGPHDNVRKIVTQLNRAVGPGNYEFLIGGLTADEMAELGLEAHASQVFPIDMPEPQRRPRLPWRRV